VLSGSYTIRQKLVPSQGRHIVKAAAQEQHEPQQQQLQRVRTRGAALVQQKRRVRGGMIPHLLSAICRARSVPSKGWKVLTTKQYKRMYKGARLLPAPGSRNP
jgi:hypothetical protein